MSNPSPSKKPGLSMGVFIAILVAIMAAISSGHSHAAELMWPDANKARFSVEVVGTGPDVVLVPALGLQRPCGTAR